MSQEQTSSETHSGRKRTLWIFLAVGFTVGILVLLGAALLSEDDSRVSIGQTPADFILNTYSGEIIDTASLRGKTVLINFWSSWCSTCDEEAIMLQEAWTSYQASAKEDVVFLGVAYMDTELDSLAFLETYGVAYSNGPDLRGEISSHYKVSSVPETFVLDAEGVLRVIKIGPFLSTEEIYNAIEKAASGD